MRRKLKIIRNTGFVLLLAALCLALMGSSQTGNAGRVWVGGTEVTQGGTFECGEGTVTYDPEELLLTMNNATVGGAFRGASIYAEGDLTLLIYGENVVSGLQHGCTVLGDLTVAGEGSILIEGKAGGVGVHGCLTVFDSADLTMHGTTPLRWGKLHASPMDAVVTDGKDLKVYAPYTVTLADGMKDADGNELHGAGGSYVQCKVKRFEPIPEPEQPERADYVFDGWYADAALTEPFDFTKAYEEDVTIYIRWAEVLGVKFDSWGGSAVTTAEYSWEDVPVQPEDPAREGWKFAGWYANAELTEEFDWNKPMTERRTAYAKWEKQADMVQQGIDVARYQEAIDWETVKASGRSFVFIRAGYRGYAAEGTLNTDLNFEVNYGGAKDAGMDIGVYFFSQATTEAEAKAEAQYVLKLLNGRALGLPVMMDYEIPNDATGKKTGRLYNAKLSNEAYAKVCLAFCKEIEQNGYTAGVYAGNEILGKGVNDALAEAGYPVWLAHWTVQTRYDGEFTYWQYSGGSDVEGIAAKTDRDVRYVTAPKQVTGLTNYAGKGYNFISWDHVAGVQGYIIYRVAADGSLTEIGRRVGAGSVNFTDYGTAPGRTYAVCAYLQVEGKELCGPISEVLTAD